jgi:hypothetical protein
MVDIHRCGHDEIEELMRFLDRHWCAGHVLATSRSLMDWQHRARDGCYDYLIARQDDRILGVLGYIRSARYDEELADRNVLWLALWKVRDDAGVPQLGLRLLQALTRAEPHAAIAVNGINFAHPPMYTALGFRVEELTQYVLVNPRRTATLLSAPPGWTPRQPAGTGTLLYDLQAGDLDDHTLLDPGVLPAKTPAYFASRFFGHPVYRYRVMRLRSQAAGKEGLLALRVATHGGRNALRIVDFAGDPALLASCGTALAGVMDQEDAEYADFWALGIAPALLAESGFERVDPHGELVVPNYFEPFLGKTARILCTYKIRAGARFQAFRADGDQDRPNQIEAPR